MTSDTSAQVWRVMELLALEVEALQADLKLRTQALDALRTLYGSPHVGQGSIPIRATSDSTSDRTSGARTRTHQPSTTQELLRVFAEASGGLTTRELLTALSHRNPHTVRATLQAGVSAGRWRRDPNDSSRWVPVTKEQTA